MNIRGQFVIPEYDFQGHKLAIGVAIRRQMQMAARAWLRAVVPKVPVYTGMARSSLAPLGRFLSVNVPISPVAKPRRNKSPALGEQQSFFQFYDNGIAFHFQWRTSVLHFIANNYYNSSLPLTHPTPWKATEAGDAAFQNYVTHILPLRIPGAKQYIKSSIITVR